MEGLSQLSNFSQELALQEQGVWAHIHFSSLGVLHEEDETPEYLALKTSRAHVWESWRAVGNRRFSLKMKVRVAQPCPVLCHPMDCIFFVTPWTEYWNG